MTIEEIQLILQTVAQNQAKHDEMHSRHSADVAEIDAGIASLLRSQNRYEERQGRLDDILHDLADKHLKNEERFAELAEARRLYEARLDKMEASYQLLEEFVRDFRRESNQRFAQTDEHFAETDKRLAALADAQAKTDEQMKRTDERVGTLTRDISAINGRVDRTGEHLDQAAESIKALSEAQTRTDEQIGKLLDRNGSTAKPKAKAKHDGTKKTAKKKRGARAK